MNNEGAIIFKSSLISHFNQKSYEMITGQKISILNPINLYTELNINEFSIPMNEIMYLTKDLMNIFDLQLLKLI